MENLVIFFSLIAFAFPAYIPPTYKILYKHRLENSGPHYVLPSNPIFGGLGQSLYEVDAEESHRPVRVFFIPLPNLNTDTNSETDYDSDNDSDYVIPFEEDSSSSSSFSPSYEYEDGEQVFEEDIPEDGGDINKLDDNQTGVENSQSSDIDIPEDGEDINKPVDIQTPSGLGNSPSSDIVEEEIEEQGIDLDNVDSDSDGRLEKEQISPRSWF